MKIVVLDGNCVNPGDITWEPVEKLGDIKVYPRTAPDKVVERIGDADIILTNKVLITEEILAACPHLKYIGVLATGYNIIDLEASKKETYLLPIFPATVVRLSVNLYLLC